MEAISTRRDDEQMDDLSGKIDALALRMDNGFNRIDADIRALRDETKKEFTVVRREMDRRFGEVDHRFDEVDHRFDEVDRRFGGVDRRFEEVNKRLDRVDHRFEAMHERLYALHRLMIQFGGAALVAVLGFLLTQG